ncbi:MAG: lysylphosphatidylglycerol synthase transmembrane domain-containing protein [Bacteroidota bacterium]
MSKTILHTDSEAKKAFETLNLNRVWLPVLLGISVVSFLFLRDDAFSADGIRLIGQARISYLLLALLTVVIHDAAFIYRIRVITQQQLGWLSSTYIIILWTFASSVTPSVVGGGVVAIFLMAREGIKAGKALAYVMLTVIFDNFFFVLSAPFGYERARAHLFPANVGAQWQGSFAYIFWVGYLLIAVYTLSMILALFVKPKGFKWLLIKITSIGPFKRWQEAASIHGDEVIMASDVLKGNSYGDWASITLTSFVAWAMRFVILNALISAYVPLNFSEHIIVFSKHLVLWVMMLISPTPGSSGAAEFFFQQFYQSTLGEYTLATDFIWRMFTYYLYLLLGVICLPRWLKHQASRQQ